MSGFKHFVNKNLVAIVMVPTIILLHVGWNNIQNIESLVSKSEKKDLPIVIGAKLLTEKITAEKSDQQGPV